MTRTDHYIAAALTGLLAQNRSYTDFELLDTATRLGVRLNSLAYKGLRTLAELAKCSRNDLLAIPNFGNRSLKEVIRALDSAGMKLRE